MTTVFDVITWIYLLAFGLGVFVAVGVVVTEIVKAIKRG